MWVAVLVNERVDGLEGDQARGWVSKRVSEWLGE